MPSLLIVEDSPAMIHMYKGFLANEPYDIQAVETLGAGREAVGASAPDLILLDIQLPDGNGLDLLKTLAEMKMAIPVIVMTAHGSINVAVDAMREGAYDFLVKPFAKERLLRTLHNARETKQLKTQVEEFQKTERPKYHSIIGSSLAMQAVYRTIDAAAPSDATVFITGETGTGKELVAHSVHAQSKRRNKNCVVLNCAAIPKDLIESEIFGHVKGAFTGATENRDGAAHLAHRGTLFLDEIGEMELSLQSKLLRFLQSGTFNRVGSSKTEEVDVRFVCATNRDPWAEVQKGRFREDLYYRLNVIPVGLPPLRERGQDIIEIAEKFLLDYSQADKKGFKGLSEEVRRTFLSYSWPGNIRQLQNVMRNIVVLNDGPQVTAQMIPPLEAPIEQPAGATAKSRFQPVLAGGTDLGDQAGAVNDSGSELALRPMWQVEQEMIDRALAQFDGNVNKVAALLEISPSSIYRKRSA